MKCRTSTSTPRRRSPRTIRSHDCAIPPRTAGRSRSARAPAAAQESSKPPPSSSSSLGFVVVPAVVGVAPVRVVRAPVHGRRSRSSCTSGGGSARPSGWPARSMRSVERRASSSRLAAHSTQTCPAPCGPRRSAASTPARGDGAVRAVAQREEAALARAQVEAAERRVTASSCAPARRVRRRPRSARAAIRIGGTRVGVGLTIVPLSLTFVRLSPGLSFCFGTPRPPSGRGRVVAVRDGQRHAQLGLLLVLDLRLDLPARVALGLARRAHVVGDREVHVARRRRSARGPGATGRRRTCRRPCGRRPSCTAGVSDDLLAVLQSGPVRSIHSVERLLRVLVLAQDQHAAGARTSAARSARRACARSGARRSRRRPRGRRRTWRSNSATGPSSRSHSSGLRCARDPAVSTIACCSGGERLERGLDVVHAAIQSASAVERLESRHAALPA